MKTATHVHPWLKMPKHGNIFTTHFWGLVQYWSTPGHSQGLYENLTGVSLVDKRDIYMLHDMPLALYISAMEACIVEKDRPTYDWHSRISDIKLME